jgi:ankyrin repeat protein
MGTQAVCTKEMDVFNERIKRIYSLWIEHLGSYSRMVSDLRRELSEAVTEKEASRIESAVDLMAFAECVAVAQKSDEYSYLIDQEKELTGDERLSKIKGLTYSQRIESLGGLETIGIAIDQYNVKTFEEYIAELKTIANRASVEFLILELSAEHHAVTIIYSPDEQCWYCIDANNLPIQKKGSDQHVAKWVFNQYNLFYFLSKKRLLISTNVQLLGKDIKCSKAFEKWREIQKKNRLRNLTPREINQRDRYNTAPLQAVARLERLSESSCAPMLCSLLDRGADPNYADESSITPLIHVIQAEDIEAAKVLIGHGAYLNIRTEDGWTALMCATRNGNTEMVKLLLKAGADPDVKDNENWTALMLASRYSNIEMVKALLEAGAEPDVKDNEDWTALMLASRHGNREMVKSLLEAGADPDEKDNENWSRLKKKCI